jgi:hypothetical protein
MMRIFLPFVPIGCIPSLNKSWILSRDMWPRIAHALTLGWMRCFSPYTLQIAFSQKTALG